MELSGNNGVVHNDLVEAERLCVSPLPTDLLGKTVSRTNHERKALSILDVLYIQL